MWAKYNCIKLIAVDLKYRTDMQEETDWQVWAAQPPNFLGQSPSLIFWLHIDSEGFISFQNSLFLLKNARVDFYYLQGEKNASYYY